MNTFNLAFIVGKNGSLVGAPVATIVCASEGEINQETIQSAAMLHFQEALRSCSNLEEVFQKVTFSIQRECCIQAVIVKADCAAIVSFNSV